MTSLRHLFVPLTLSCATTLALAQAPTQTANQRYQAERAACMQGQTGQARDVCLKEAAAALAESRRGNLATADADLRANALKRCDPLPAADRAACQKRVNDGQTSGSVSGGGTMTTHTQTVPAGKPAPVQGAIHGDQGHGAKPTAAPQPQHKPMPQHKPAHPAKPASAASAAR